MNNIKMQSCVILENRIWFVTVDNRFMWMDLSTGETHYVMPKGNRMFKNVIDPMFIFGRQIYWADQDGKRLLSYNLDSRICKAYELNYIKVKSYVAFSLITKWQDTIIFVPKYSDMILIFNTQEESFTEKCGIFKEYLVGDKGYVEHAFVIDKYIFIFFIENHIALRYSMDTGETCSIDRNGLEKEILSSYWCGNRNVLYVLDSEGDVLVVNRNFELIRNFSSTGNRLEGYSCLFVVGTHLIILPSTAKEIISINLENQDRKVINIPTDMAYENKNWGKYIGYTESGNLILVPNRVSNYICCFNKNEWDICWIKPSAPGNKEEARYMTYAGIDVFEDDNLGLLLEYVCQDANQSMEI